MSKTNQFSSLDKFACQYNYVTGKVRKELCRIEEKWFQIRVFAFRFLHDIKREYMKVIRLPSWLVQS